MAKTNDSRSPGKSRSTDTERKNGNPKAKDGENPMAASKSRSSGTGKTKYLKGTARRSVAKAASES